VRNLKVPNPPLSRNCEREDSVNTATGKLGRPTEKVALIKPTLKPGDFGIHAPTFGSVSVGGLALEGQVSFFS